MTTNTIYISDLDRTLLRDDATLSGYSYSGLARMIESGLQFTVASARSVVSMRQMLRGLELPLPVIEFNGAFITNMTSGEKLVVNDLKQPTLDVVYGVLLDSGVSPFISTFDGTDDRVYYDAVRNEGMDWYVNDRLTKKDNRFRVVEDVAEHLGERVVCITVIERRQKIQVIRKKIEETIQHGIEVNLFENFYQPDWYWLTIHDGRATKDQAIEHLLRVERLEHAETVVFGDHLNDLGMFKTASRSVAVANAEAELKNHATCVVGTNEEDSVVKYIENEWEKR